MRRVPTWVLIVSLFCILASSFADDLKASKTRTQPSATKPGLDGFDDFVDQALKDWKVPGVAVAVVQGDKVILLKGYGYRDAEEQLPVTPNTVFAIGSITKSFTVTTLGMEVRDLITHRTGLPRHDLVWYSSDFPREDLIQRLQFLEPNKPLRSRFQYNNLMFMTAGYIVGQLNGKSWEDTIRERVLAPLEMNGTTFSVKDSQNAPDFAQPYRKGFDVKSEVKRIPFDEQCPDRCAIGPAGEINSNAADMSRYLLFHLNKGKLEGKVLLSSNNAVQMQTPQMVIQGAPDYKEESETSYGMGFFISAYRGHKNVGHGGNLDG